MFESIKWDELPGHLSNPQFEGVQLRIIDARVFEKTQGPVQRFLFSDNTLLAQFAWSAQTDTRGTPIWRLYDPFEEPIPKHGSSLFQVGDGSIRIEAPSTGKEYLIIPKEHEKYLPPEKVPGLRLNRQT